MFKTQPDDLINSSREQLQRGNKHIVVGGLTKREYFAIMILAGYQNSSTEIAVDLADKLIEKLNEKKG